MNNIKTDRMRYQPNSISFWLCILAIILNVVAMINLYEYKVDEVQIINDVFIGIDVLANIIFMLFVFLGSVKSKAYNKGWGYKLIALAAMQIGRIFLAPLVYFNRGQYALANFVLNISMLILSAAALTVAAVVCLIKSGKLVKHIKTLEKGEV